MDTGRFVHVALSATNHIAAFSVDSGTGGLTPVPGSRFSTGEVPTVFALTKNFLYVVNAFDGSISGYRLDPRCGALRPVPGSPFGTDGGAIEVDASGRYLYSERGDGIQGYTINPRTGALSVRSEWFVENGILGLTILELPRQAEP